jgi:tetratricopeptide (TPR) repeat protein
MSTRPRHLIAVCSTAALVVLAARMASAQTPPPAVTQPALSAPQIIDAHLKANRLDDAFKEASEYLTGHPRDLSVLLAMTFAGVGEARRQNPKYVPDSEKYGLAAIAILEAEAPPASPADLPATQDRTKALALLYQSVALCSLVAGRSEEAATRLSKSVALNARDPVSYAFLSTIHNQQYEAAAGKYKAAAAGQGRDDALRDAMAALDRVIDDDAHVVALSDGNPALKAMHDAILEDLTSYFKYRHTTTDGLQALIDKYKVPGTSS